MYTGNIIIFKIWFSPYYIISEKLLWKSLHQWYFRVSDKNLSSHINLIYLSNGNIAFLFGNPFLCFGEWTSSYTLQVYKAYFHLKSIFRHCCAFPNIQLKSFFCSAECFYVAMKRSEKSTNYFQIHVSCTTWKLLSWRKRHLGGSKKHAYRKMN